MNDLLKGFISQFKSHLADIGDSISHHNPSANPAGLAAWNRQEGVHNAVHSVFKKTVSGPLKNGALRIPGALQRAGENIFTTKAGLMGLGVGTVGIMGARYAYHHGDGEGLEHDVTKTAALGMGVNLAAKWGAKGSATMIGGLGMAAAGAALSAGRTAEFGARALMTGSFRNLKHGQPIVNNALDAWLPNYRNTPLRNAEGAINPHKFAVNPSVVKRAIGGAALAAIGTGALGAITPKAPPPTAYFDGQFLRRQGDMGAHSGYADQIRGSGMSDGMDLSAFKKNLVHLI